MIKYVRLQLFLVSKRISTYIVPVIFALSIFLSIGLPIMLSDKISLSEMFSSSASNPMGMSLTMIVPFIISIIFVAIKALNIFKDSEEDGTELLIVSKPITRTKLVFGKFMSLYSLIILFSIFSVITCSIIGSVDKHASSLEIFKFSISITFGTLIIQLLFSSVIVFVASILGKVGTMTVSILFPLILAIASMILPSFSDATLSYEKNQFQHYVVSKNNNDKYESKPITGFEKSNDTLNKIFNKHEKSWYKPAAYFDVYKQMSSFYSIFESKEISPTSLSKWVKTNENKKITDMMDKTLFYKSKDKILIIKNYNKNYDRLNIKSNNDFVNLLNLAEKLYSSNSDYVAQEMGKWLKKNPSNTVNDMYEEMFKILKNNSNNNLPNEWKSKLISNYFLINILNDQKWSNKTMDNFLNKYSSNLYLVLNEENTIPEYIIIKGSPYIPTALLYGMWLIITFSMGGLVMLRYLRRDFK